MKQGHGLMGRIAHDFVQGLASSLEAEQVAGSHGYLQRLDPRAKLVMAVMGVAAASATRSLMVLGLLFLLAIVVALLSRVPLRAVARRVWLTVALFTGLIALPALVLVPGETLWLLPWTGWTVTQQGVRSAAFLIGRGEVCVSLLALLVMTTPWPHVLKAMRSLGVPVVVVALLGMTQRYVFLLVHLTLQMFEARRSRVLAQPDAAATRRLALSMLGVLLARSVQLAGEVHQAMLARGYRGEIHLLDDFRMRGWDWWSLALACGLFVGMVVAG